MKKIIVTGHNGFIGPHLVNFLKESGYFVKGIDTNYFNDDCKFSNYTSPHEEVIKDVRLIDESDLEGAYAICHLAGLSNDPMGALNTKLTGDINHLASVKIAKLCKKVGVEKYIFSSSCSMYGISDGSKAIDETADFAPLTAYAESKVETEKDVQSLKSDDFCVTFLRNATAYGLSPKLRLDLVVNNLVGWATVYSKIKILSDGSPWRPLVHCEDIARAFIAVIESDCQTVNGQAYNVGQLTENYQVKDIAKIVGEVVPGCSVEITGEHGSDSRSYKVDFNKIKKSLPNFKPKWTLKPAIENIYKGFRDFGMDQNDFNGRKFIRLNQLEYLSNSNKLNNNLEWK